MQSNASARRNGGDDGDRLEGILEGASIPEDALLDLLMGSFSWRSHGRSVRNMRSSRYLPPSSPRPGLQSRVAWPTPSLLYPSPFRCRCWSPSGMRCGSGIVRFQMRLPTSQPRLRSATPRESIFKSRTGWWNLFSGWTETLGFDLLGAKSVIIPPIPRIISATRVAEATRGQRDDPAGALGVRPSRPRSHVRAG